jgi:hypothetical protein
VSECHVLFKDNDLILEISGLRNEVSGAFLDTATVTVSLADVDGNPVTGAAWPLPLDYVAGSDGIYRVTLVDTLELTPDTRYLATLTADGGGNLRATWQLDCICQVRT